MAIFSDDEELKPQPEPKKAHEHPHKSKVLERGQTDFDKSFENNIRPKKFNGYIGQSALKDTLKNLDRSSKKEKTAARPPAFLRPAGARKNNNCRRNRKRAQHKN